MERSSLLHWEASSRLDVVVAQVFGGGFQMSRCTGNMQTFVCVHAECTGYRGVQNLARHWWFGVAMMGMKRRSIGQDQRSISWLMEGVRAGRRQPPETT
jgi:hypothetical protein